MELALVLLTIVIGFNIGVLINSCSSFEKLAAGLSILFTSIITGLVYDSGIKDASIDCLNGKNKYEKQYLICDSVVIDSVYVLKSRN
jgi:hypothetical protein